MPKLSEGELAGKLAELPEWRVADGQLTRRYTFSDFRASLAFVNRLGEEAEARQHHPDMDIRYNRVSLMLVTHDQGGITEKDTELAAVADKAARELA